MVRIDRRSGRRVFGTWPTDEPKAAVIWEAFKPESEPRRSINRSENAQATRPAQRRTTSRPKAAPAQQRDSDFLQSEGGIY